MTIAEWDVLKPLFKIEYDELYNHIEEYPITVIPYSSLGNPDGIIPIFTADFIEFENNRIQNAIIGISQNPLFAKGSCHALIGSGLI